MYKIILSLQHKFIEFALLHTKKHNFLTKWVAVIVRNKLNTVTKMLQNSEELFLNQKW